MTATHVKLDVLLYLKSNSTGLSGGFCVVVVVFAVEVGGTPVDGIADDFEGVGVIDIEGLVVWCDVEVCRSDVKFCEIVEDTKTKVAIILQTF